jgi:hypothetical protein
MLPAPAPSKKRRRSAFANFRRWHRQQERKQQELGVDAEVADALAPLGTTVTPTMTAVRWHFALLVLFLLLARRHPLSIGVACC